MLRGPGGLGRLPAPIGSLRDRELLQFHCGEGTSLLHRLQDSALRPRMIVIELRLAPLFPLLPARFHERPKVWELGDGDRA